MISGGDRLSEDLFSLIWKFEMNFAMLVSRKGVVLRTWRDLEGVGASGSPSQLGESLILEPLFFSALLSPQLALAY